MVRFRGYRPSGDRATRSDVVSESVTTSPSLAPSLHTRRWRVAAGAVLAFGLVGSAAGGIAWNRRSSSDARNQSAQRANDLAAATGSLISREVDVTDGALK